MERGNGMQPWREKNLMSYFEAVKDPRIHRTRKYELMDVMITALCAVIGGVMDGRRLFVS